MIKDATGNIFDVKVDALVNPVNCVGVMGAGLALQFKRMYPMMFECYVIHCREHQVHIGAMDVHCVGPTNVRPEWVINFPTKNHFKSDSVIADIELGLRDLVRVIYDKGIHSIAIPRLGCGLGGLDWKDVRPLIEHHLGSIENLTVLLF